MGETIVYHQNSRTRFRPTDSTVILDTSMTLVNGRARRGIARQTKQAPVKAGDKQSLLQTTVAVDSTGYEVTNIDGAVHIEGSSVFSIQIGGAFIECNGVFAFTGKLASLVIVAPTPTPISITAVLHNL